jgi:Trypsin-like peptidase domain
MPDPSEPGRPSPPLVATLDKWKWAVVAIEGVGDKISPDGFAARALEYCDETARKKLSGEELRALMERDREEFVSGIGQVRPRGTAIFLRHEASYFLVTARHVLHDMAQAAAHQKEATTANTPTDAALAQELVDLAVLKYILRIPLLSEYLSEQAAETAEAFLDLDPKRISFPGIGPKDKWYASFSAPHIDLAVLSLQDAFRHFADDILRLGYSPITFDDVDDGPSAEGAEVFSVGFPATISLYDRTDLSPDAAKLRSKAVALPAFSFGRVAMLYPSLHQFWTDLQIYPGHSGGPVVEAGRLVGVAHESAVEPVRRRRGGAWSESKTAWMNVPFGAAVPAREIRPLVEEQMKKDERRLRFPS